MECLKKQIKVRYKLDPTYLLMSVLQIVMFPQRCLTNGWKNISLIKMIKFKIFKIHNDKVRKCC